MQSMHSTSASESGSESDSSSTSASTSVAAPPVFADIDYTHVSPRFSVEDDASLQLGLAYLEENGYAVFKDVCSPAEVTGAHDAFWSWVGSTFRLDRVSRHKVASWNDLAAMQTGVMWTGGCGNSSWQWYVRSLPGIKKIFSEVWGGETNLLASMDGCGVFRPSITGGFTSGSQQVKQQFKPEWVTKSAWFHVDQNPVAKPGKECVQGQFSVFEQNANTGGLVVIPGSHLAFNSLASLIKTKSTGDFIPVPNGHFLLDTEAGAEKPRLVHCGAGDFILWDSRTIHCNSPALRDQLFLKKHAALDPKDTSGMAQLAADHLASIPADFGYSCPPPAAADSSSSASASSSPASAPSGPLQQRLQRLVSYQCMVPFSKVHPKAFGLYKAARLDAIKNGVTANHWPHEWHGGSTIHKGDVHTPVQLSKEQRALAVGEGN